VIIVFLSLFFILILFHLSIFLHELSVCILLFFKFRGDVSKKLGRIVFSIVMQVFISTLIPSFAVFR
jgi:hypothetical protein